MSLLGPVTEADRQRWQHAAMLALMELLAARKPAKMPPVIDWRVTRFQQLVGQAQTGAQVAAWAELLEAEVTSTDHGDGVTRHRCEAVWRKVSVVVLAQEYPEAADRPAQHVTGSGVTG